MQRTWPPWLVGKPNKKTTVTRHLPSLWVCPYSTRWHTQKKHKERRARYTCNFGSVQFADVFINFAIIANWKTVQTPGIVPISGLQRCRIPGYGVFMRQRERLTRFLHLRRSKLMTVKLWSWSLQEAEAFIVQRALPLPLNKLSHSVWQLCVNTSTQEPVQRCSTYNPVNLASRCDCQSNSHTLIGGQIVNTLLGGHGEVRRTVIDEPNNLKFD